MFELAPRPKISVCKRGLSFHVKHLDMRSLLHKKLSAKENNLAHSQLRVTRTYPHEINKKKIRTFRFHDNIFTHAVRIILVVIPTQISLPLAAKHSTDLLLLTRASHKVFYHTFSSIPRHNHAIFISN